MPFCSMCVLVKGYCYVCNFMGTDLESAQMGTADCILDLVSSGTTLRENNLKEIDGGAVLSSQVYFPSSPISCCSSITRSNTIAPSS